MKSMKKKVVIIVIAGLFLIGTLGALSYFFGWLSPSHNDGGQDVAPVDFVYNPSEPISLPNKTKVFDLILVDMSGSMEPLRTSVVESCNTLLDGLKESQKLFGGTQEHFVRLSFFTTGLDTNKIKRMETAISNGDNSQITKLYEYYRNGEFMLKNVCLWKKLEEVNSLGLKQYCPMGGTPLFDAIGTTVDQLRKNTDTMMSDYLVLVTIISDGLENSSTKYTSDKVSMMIEELSEKGWCFSYMGTDENVIQEALGLGIDSVYYFDHSDTGMMNAMRIDQNSRISTYRAIDSLRRRQAWEQSK